MSDDDHNFTFSFGDGTEIFKANIVDTPDGPTFSGPLSYARPQADLKEDDFLRLIWHDMWCPNEEAGGRKALAWFIFVFGGWLLALLTTVDLILYLTFTSLFS